MTFSTEHRFLQALNRQPVDRTPVWMMRQAGRYLPEYRQVRAEAGSFLNLMKKPELACEVTLQPLRRFDLDAAILFSDILTVPDAMGLGLQFVEGEGPVFTKPIRSVEQIDALPVADIAATLDYVYEAIKKIKVALAGKTPLIGFAGSPWTIATYMVEGGSSKNFSLIKKMLYSCPEQLHQLLTKVACVVTEYVLAQIAAGVDAIMLFDTWGGVLTPPAYRQFSLHYMETIVQAVQRNAPQSPIILFTKGGGQWLEWIAATGCQGVGLDWTVPIEEAFQRVGQQVAIQGNLDPGVLQGHPSVIVAEVERILAAVGDRPGHLFNLGHGIYPQTPPENVSAMLEAIHARSLCT